MNLEILIAEDDANTRSALVEILQSEGHRVTQAADGQQARFLFDRHRPDLACLDVMMPGLSGFDLCRHFRQIAPRMPILFITAKAEEIDKVVGLELGADDYIVKPFGAKEVVARIRAVARRCIDGGSDLNIETPLTTSDFWMDDVEIMPAQLRARRGKETVDLTSRELKILQLLHAKAGEVVDRAELFRIGWGQHHLPNSRTLDQTISQLRKRIEADAKDPKIIQTVYGVGYRFQPAGEP